MMMKFCLLFFFIFGLTSAMMKCTSNDECSSKWPMAECVRSRCRCPDDYIRKKSKSRDWICLSVTDAATGQSGPPLTCPLPEGAGYQVILRNNSLPVFCSTTNDNCALGYECIQGLSVLGVNDGVCCPDKGTTCVHPIFDHDDGQLLRWGFDGTKCVSFNWNPERPSSANNFKSKEHCEDYCINEIPYILLLK